MSLKKISWWINFFFRITVFFVWKLYFGILFVFGIIFYGRCCDVFTNFEISQTRRYVFQINFNYDNSNIWWVERESDEKKLDTQVHVSDFFCTDFKKGLIFLKNRNVCISLKNKLYFCHSLKKMKVIHLCKKRTYLPIACIPFFKIIILQEYNKDSIHFSC